MRRENVWPEPPPEDDRCYCFHGQSHHDDGTGACHHRGYAEACNCHRYRNLAAIRRARREEAFWATVGGHDW